MSGFETIRYEIRDGIAGIALARPDKRNAVNRRMFEELGDAAAAAAGDADVRGVLVGGDGPSFCAGIDLQVLGELAGVQGEPFREFVRLAQRPFLLLATMPKPTLAVVQGHAIGAGCQLALACDLRVAAEGARFSVMEARYGLIPDLGGIHRLAHLVGPAVTKELVWTTRDVDADEALRLGIVNRVCAAEALSGEAANLLGEATAHSPTVVSLAKSLIDGVVGRPIDQEMEREADAQAVAVAGDDHREAVAAFLERREPRYRSG
jgi:enoyl-CoA hydratase/carnithine racemase